MQLIGVSHVTGVSGEEDIVVALPRTDHLEGQWRHEREVERVPSLGLRISRWGSGVQGVTKVHSHISRFGRKRDGRQTTGFPCAGQAGGAPV